MTIFEALKSHGLTITPTFNSEVHREGNQFFIGSAGTLKNGKYYAWANFGDWSKQLDIKWDSKDDLNQDERKEYEKLVKEKAEAFKAEQQALHELRASWCDESFATLRAGAATPYTTRKCLGNLYGAKISVAPASLKPSEDVDLIIPLRDVEGKLWNYQTIWPAKRMANGKERDKDFVFGARKKACFYLLETTHHQVLDKAPAIYITEGYATACSVQDALGIEAYVLCAFDCTNLGPVGEALREKYPDVKLIYCADNDAYTVVQGESCNPGRDAAIAAAELTDGEVVYPIFPHPDKKLTDFNDLFCATRDLCLVADQIRNPLSHRKEIVAVPTKGKKRGSAQMVTDYILDFYGDTLYRQADVLFVYARTHWHLLEKEKLALLRRQIDTATGRKWEPKDINACYKYLLDHIPQLPDGRTFFQPNPFAANFLNGTLHFVRKSNGTHYTSFRPHDPQDLLTCVLPFHYSDPRGTPLPPAPMFDQWLSGLWSNDPDQADKVRLLYQLGGATLLPAFPAMALFIGPPSSGKSTIIKLLIKLIGLQNTSSVQPSKWDNFHMKGMLGKLINYDTDISTTKPFVDDMVKKAIDRVAVPVNRKNQDEVLAYLPPVHLFASNQLPRTLDGASRAYARRLILFKTDSFKAPANFTHDYEQVMLEAERDAIVARFIMGIFDLMDQGGRYSVPDSSRIMVQEMETRSDIHRQFIDDLRENEIRNIRGVFGPEEVISRLDLWDRFQPWLEQNYANRRFTECSERNRLFAAMRSMGFEETKFDGERRFRGISISGSGGNSTV